MFKELYILPDQKSVMEDSELFTREETRQQSSLFLDLFKGRFITDI